MATVPLSQLAFGLAAGSAAGTLTVTAGDRVWQTDSDVSASFTVVSGRITVWIAAKIVIGLDASTEGVKDYYGYSISGPDNIATSTNRALMDVFPFGRVWQTFAVYEHSGLDAGDYTITGAAMRSNVAQSDTENTPVTVSQRTIVVLPY